MISSRRTTASKPRSGSGRTWCNRRLRVSGSQGHLGGPPAVCPRDLLLRSRFGNRHVGDTGSGSCSMRGGPGRTLIITAFLRDEYVLKTDGWRIRSTTETCLQADSRLMELSH